MIRLWDYKCEECSNVVRDWPYSTKHVPRTIPCPACGGRCTWTTMRKNHIHSTAGGMKYGQFDPQFGCVVEDYGHRQRLLRERGMREVGGPETREQIAEDLYERRAKQAAARARGDSRQVLRADSIEEITSQIDQDMIDRRATGSMRRPMQDSWVAFEDTDDG